MSFYAEQQRRNAEIERAMIRRLGRREFAWLVTKRVCIVASTVALCVIAWKLN